MTIQKEENTPDLLGCAHNSHLVSFEYVLFSFQQTGLGCFSLIILVFF
jgi:hypothetical protein